LVETFDTVSNGGINGLAFSPDSSKIADSGSIVASEKVPEGVLEVWNVAKGDLDARLPTKSAVVYGIAFSPDGATLAAGGYTQSAVGSAELGSLEFWSVATSKLVKSAPLEPGTTGVYSVTYSANGSTLYASSSVKAEEIQVFNPVTNRAIGSYALANSNAMALSPITGAVAFVTNGAFAGMDEGLSVAAMPSLVAVEIEKVTLSSTSVLGGATCTGVVTLTQPAPAGGAVVELQGNQYATTPASVTIPAGQTTAAFTVTALHVQTTSTGVIKVSSGTYSRSAILTVKPGGH